MKHWWRVSVTHTELLRSLIAATGLLFFFGLKRFAAHQSSFFSLRIFIKQRSYSDKQQNVSNERKYSSCHDSNMALCFTYRNSSISSILLQYRISNKEGSTTTPECNEPASLGGSETTVWPEALYSSREWLGGSGGMATELCMLPLSPGSQRQHFTLPNGGAVLWTRLAWENYLIYGHPRIIRNLWNKNWGLPTTPSPGTRMVQGS